LTSVERIAYDGFRKVPPMTQVDEPSTNAPIATLPWNVKLLGLVSLLNDTASDMIFPLLPLFMTKELGGTAAALGLMEGMSESAASVLKLYSGGWSDRAGTRKPFVVAGYLLAGLTRPIMAIVTAPWQLVGIRLASLIGKGIRTAPRDALIADS